jgi:hypothetical protein
LCDRLRAENRARDGVRELPNSLANSVRQKNTAYRFQEGLMPGKHKGLYEYLDRRYANTVVLTFAQIEDLLGFKLPNSAHVDKAWWTNNGPNDSPQLQSRSWTLANRTATPNLNAHTVMFERVQA